MGIRGGVAGNTLSHASSVRDWKLHAAFTQRIIHAATGLLHEDGIDLDNMAPEPEAFRIMDRACHGFARLHALHANAAHFVLQAMRNTKLTRLHARQADRMTEKILDRTVAPADVKGPS